MLLESQTSSELLCTFISLRKTALTNVIQKLHPSVRHQLAAMVKCLTTTVHLLHHCFICKYKNIITHSQILIFRATSTVNFILSTFTMNFLCTGIV